MDALLARQAAEREAHAQAMAKLPKKKRWEVPALDEALAERHAAERAALAGEGGGAEGADADGENGDDLLARMAAREEEAEAESKKAAEAAEQEQEKDRAAAAAEAAQRKRDKAARKREKRADAEAAKAAARAAEAEAIAAQGPSAKAREEEAVAQALLARSLVRREVSSDGHCMYRALSHQLARVGAEPLQDHVALRKLAADHMRANRERFEPFAFDAAEALGVMVGDDWFGEYCSAVATTAAWGGQLELQALSDALQRRIVVVCADAPDVVCGDQHDEGSALTVVYMRHAFGLGEHYDSVEEASGSESLS